MAVPGEMEKGKNWQSRPKLPQVMDTGKNFKEGQMPLSDNSGQTTVKNMKWYIYDANEPTEKKTTDETLTTEPTDATRVSNPYEQIGQWLQQNPNIKFTIQ